MKTKKQKLKTRNGNRIYIFEWDNTSNMFKDYMIPIQTFQAKEYPTLRPRRVTFFTMPETIDKYYLGISYDYDGNYDGVGNEIFVWNNVSKQFDFFVKASSWQGSYDMSFWNYQNHTYMFLCEFWGNVFF